MAGRTELKPCPFCGKQPLTHEYSDTSGKIECQPPCPVGMFGLDPDDDAGYPYSLLQLIEVWNTRYADQNKDVGKLNSRTDKE